MEGFHITVRTSALPLAGSYSILHVSLISTQGKIVSDVLDHAESHLLPGSVSSRLYYTLPDVAGQAFLPEFITKFKLQFICVYRIPWKHIRFQT